MTKSKGNLRLRRLVLQERIVSDQKDIDSTRTKLEDLERMRSELECGIDVRNRVISEHRTTIGDEVASEYRRQIDKHVSDVDALAGRQADAESSLNDSEQSLSRLLDASSKTRKADAIATYHEASAEARRQDAELNGMQYSGEASDD